MILFYLCIGAVFIEGATLVLMLIEHDPWQRNTWFNKALRVLVGPGVVSKR